MEKFWGVEVENGKCLKVSPGDGLVLHISQASLGESKSQKGKENVHLFVHVDGKKLVLGTLITNKLPQYQFDLSLDQDFELSHNWESGSVYFYGYKANESESKENVDTSLDPKTNGKTESKAKQEKPADAQKDDAYDVKSDAGSDPIKIAETHTHLNTQEADESTFEDIMSDDGKDDSQAITSKKRPLESVEVATITPICEKKAKAIPEEIDDNKTAPLIIGNEDCAAPPTSQPNKQKLKKYPCKFCHRRFATEKGVKDHTKGKHIL